MKKLYALFTFLSMTVGGFSQQVGDLDISFGINGTDTTDVGPHAEAAYSLAVQPDGKIVLAGYAFINSDDIAIARYMPDGAVDTAFGTQGFVFTDIGIGNNGASSVVIDTSGRIIVAGAATFLGSQEDFSVSVYKPDGSLDTSFDHDGILTFSLGSSYDHPYVVALQADQKILVAGYAYSGFNPAMGIARLNTDGTFDTTFNHTAGVVMSAVPGSNWDIIYALAVQPDGKILAGGNTTVAGSRDFALVRFNSNGSLDTSFSNDGIVTTSMGPGLDEIKGIALQTNGKIVVTGTVNYGLGDIGVARYNTDGSLDTSYSNDGMNITVFSPNNDQATGIAIQADNKVIVSAANWNFPNFALFRYDTTGVLDASFGTAGIVTQPSFSSGVAYSVKIQADGKILAAGYLNSPIQSHFAVARYLTELNISVPETEKNEDPFSLFPNPGSESVTADLRSLSGEKTTLTICDITGRELQRIDDQGALVHLDISHLTSGIYFVQAKTAGKILSQKLVVTR